MLRNLKDGGRKACPVCNKQKTTACALSGLEDLQDHHNRLQPIIKDSSIGPSLAGTWPHDKHLKYSRSMKQPEKISANELLKWPMIPESKIFTPRINYTAFIKPLPWTSWQMVTFSDKELITKATHFIFKLLSLSNSLEQWNKITPSDLCPFAKSLPLTEPVASSEGMEKRLPLWQDRWRTGDIKHLAEELIH